MAKKLTTEEILAQCRQEVQNGSGGDDAAPAASPPEETPATKQPTGEAAAAKPADTAGMSPLEAARAQGAGGGAKPKADTSGMSPLEAARAQGAGGGAKPKADTAGMSPLEAARAQGAAGGAKPKVDTTGMSPLEAARAQGAAGGAGKKAAPAAKAGAKPAPRKAPPGDLSPAEMLKSMREGKKAPTVAEKKAPTKPKPASKKRTGAKEEEKVTRRNFLVSTVATPFAAAWTAFIATCSIALLGTARFMFPNVLVEPPSKFKVGPPSDYPLNSVSTKWKAQFGVWIVHTDSYKGNNLIYALASVCTHLGCTPSWLDGEQKFKCPCHGSGFYMNGVNFEGPAPRPLERVGLTLAPDGMLEVDKSLKFQEELGQWTDESSFVSVS